MSARHFELLKRPGLIVPEAAFRRRSINYSGSKPPVLTYVAAIGDTSGSTGGRTYSVSFGTADPKRYILIGAAIQDPSVVSTIGGIAAVEVYRVEAGANTRVAAWYIAPVPTGTSGSVVVTTPGSGINWVGGIVIYSLVATNPKLVATATDNSIPTSSWPLSIPAGSVALVLTNGFRSGTWSGGITQDSWTSYASGSALVGSASTHANTTGSITPSYTTDTGVPLAITSAAIAYK